MSDTTKAVAFGDRYKQSPDRTTKWSIHGIQIQMQIRIRIQISSLSCIYTEK